MEKMKMPVRRYKTAYQDRKLAKARRDRNRMFGSCVNENKRLTHGRATRGVRCDNCYVVHKRSA